MSQSERSWQRNTEGLRAHAQRKAEAAAQHAEAAIAQLLRERRPVNFHTVAQTAGISTAWLYGNAAIKERIMHLRQEQLPKVQIKIPPGEQVSSASKDAMIATLRQRIQKLEQENRDLKHQVEVAYGLLHQRGAQRRATDE
jgi:predicted RNase H-like nuclease (RuvC/YqgF family)